MIDFDKIDGKIVRVRFLDHFKTYPDDYDKSPKPLEIFGIAFDENDQYLFIKFINVGDFDPPWPSVFAILKAAIVSVDELLPLPPSETHIPVSLRRDYEED